MTEIKKYYNQTLTDYYLIFHHSTHWYQLFLKKNFGHVYVLTKDNYNWIILNPGKLFFKWEILPYPLTDEAWRNCAETGVSVIHLELYLKDNEASYGILGLRTCVSIVLYILGIKLNTLTPWSLFKRLLRMNTVVRNMLGIHSITLKK